MQLIGLAVVFAVGLTLAPLVAEAQQATGQRRRVGLLNAAAPGQSEAVLREGLRALGYVEGTNLVIDARAADGRVERLPALMRELLDAKPEVIVTFGTTAAQAAKAATTTTPIVMAFAGDPVGTRLVASLAKPGGNVTGMSLATSDLAGKRLDLLKEVIPKLTRLTIFGRHLPASRDTRNRKGCASARPDRGPGRAYASRGVRQGARRGVPHPSSGAVLNQHRRHGHVPGPDRRLRAKEPRVARRHPRRLGGGRRSHELRVEHH